MNRSGNTTRSPRAYKRSRSSPADGSAAPAPPKGPTIPALQNPDGTKRCAGDVVIRTDPNHHIFIDFVVTGPTQALLEAATTRSNTCPAAGHKLKMDSQNARDVQATSAAGYIPFAASAFFALHPDSASVAARAATLCFSQLGRGREVSEPDPKHLMLAGIQTACLSTPRPDSSS